MTKKFFIIANLIAIVLFTQNKLTICNDTVNNVKSTPIISFKAPVYNFGEIFKGEKVEHVYKFKNSGKGVLKIKDVKVSCGCTAAVVKSKEVLHNGNGEINIIFNSNSAVGKISKDITVYSNDPDNPMYKLTITGVINEEVVVKPRKLNIADVVYGKGIKRTLSVKSIVAPMFTISKVISTNPDIATTLTKEKEKNEYSIDVSLSKEAKLGRLGSKIVIHTNSKNMEKVTVPFYGRVVGDISIYPPRLSCGTVKQKEEKKVVVFATTYNDDVNISKVEIFPDFLEANVAKKEENEKKMTYKISVTLKKDAPVGRFKGELKIFTSSRNQPVIDVPVYGMVKEG